MQHYLTKWELYVLFVEYLRFRAVSFSPAVYFKVRSQLTTLRKQPFFQTHPNIAEDEFKQILRRKNAEEIISKRSYNKRFNVYFHNRKIFTQWLEDYLIDYKADRLHTRRELFSTYRQSMRRTLDLLRAYANINEKIIKLKPEIDDGEGNVLRTNTRTRLYEDILFMIQHKYLSLDDVILLNTNVLIDTESKEEPVFSIHLTFLKPIEEIETFICTTGIESRKSASTKPKEQDETSNTGVPSPYNLFKIEQTDPAEIETETIFYRGNPLPLKYGTKEYKLLHFLIRNKRAVTHVEVLQEIGIQFYQKTSHKTYEEQVKDKIKVLKNYCSHLRVVLGWGVELVNSKGSIYLK